ncbi:DUF6265 family protein [Sphingomicrobium aestuariivivum]|uniref:DUF6265 family protein n=1 Tax=Sphingomicrobium aestuariivivum TaxID=1582356 RepID=UPI001FD6BE0B|nr:DUF6265 family protein [Sphingomicrobium aestuariivivum]MCJ8190623.1 DUF6265 family protein [Sphingomicrobium aestuariivivum]
MIATPFIAALMALAHPAAEAEPIEDAAWLQGRWVGTGMGGEVEELWSPPLGGQMVGHFTYSKDGAPVFYELLLVRPDADGGLEMLVKHFNADFTAWEEKGEWVTFEADETGPGRLSFRGLRIVDDGGVMRATVTMRGSDGETRDVPFTLRRAQAAAK